MYIFKILKAEIQADDKVTYNFQQAKRGEECINVKKS